MSGTERTSTSFFIEIAEGSIESSDSFAAIAQRVCDQGAHGAIVLAGHSHRQSSLESHVMRVWAEMGAHRPLIVVRDRVTSRITKTYVPLDFLQERARRAGGQLSKHFAEETLKERSWSVCEIDMDRDSTGEKTL